MDEATRRLTPLTLIVATAAAFAQALHAAGAGGQIVQLERVVITGERILVEATWVADKSQTAVRVF